MKDHSNRLSYIIMVIGFTLSAVLAYQMASLKNETLREQIKSEMKELSLLVAHDLALNFEGLYTVQGLLASSTSVTQVTFDQLAEQTISRHRHLRGVQWAPRVMSAQRAAFEQQMRQTFSDYQILEPTTDNSRIPARNRAVHFPIALSRPTGDQLGIDLAGQSVPLAAIRQALQSGEMTISDPLAQPGSKADLQNTQRNFLAILPVFRERNSPHNQIDDLRGVLVGQFTIWTLVRDALTTSHLAGLHVTLFDLTTQQQHGFDASVLFSQMPASPAVDDMAQRFMLNNLGGHNWQLIVAPSEGFIHERKSSVAYIVMLLGIIITGFLTAYLRMMARRNQQQMIAIKEKNHEIQLSHKHLEQLNQTDGLTGISNRHYFEECFDLEWKRTRRERQPIALVMFDLDCFQHFNEVNGRLRGDECLRNIAELVKTTIHRPGDLFARFDGQRFVLLLPNTPSSGARVVGEQCRQLVESIALPHRRSTIAEVVTVSVGVCSLIPENSMHHEQMLDMVDQALALAKQRGRNQVVDAESESIRPRTLTERPINIDD